MKPPIHHSNSRTGKVIFIGAGPGDPELLTIKALRYLQQADIVVADRLVSPGILSAYVTPGARIIHAGKQGAQPASTAQPAINELLVKHASAGRLVVRLKGGDISVFSNILDELEALTMHNIAFQLVPGVTAALGAAAYAGIPLTARGLATAVRFLTAYRQDLMDERYWEGLARTDDTLVFYMSSAPVDEIVSRLIRHGIAADRWIAVVQQATTPQQLASSWPVHDYLASAAGAVYASPSLIIIGRVAALHQSFRWLQEDRGGELYFPALTDSKKIAVC